MRPLAALPVAAGLLALCVAAGLLAAAGPGPAPQQGARVPAPPPSASPPNPGGDLAAQGIGPPQAAPTGTPDHVVAIVEGHPIYLGDLGKAEQALPANMRNMPLASLYPVLLAAAAWRTTRRSSSRSRRRPTARWRAYCSAWTRRRR
jgi:hypothetical protein